jgi:hypothetical protein
LQGTLTIQNRDGHEVIEYDTAVSDGPLDPAVAEARFNEMVGRGGFAFAETITGEREMVREFNPETMAKVTMVPQIAGGC